MRNRWTCGHRVPDRRSRDVRDDACGEVLPAAVTCGLPAFSRDDAAEVLLCLRADRNRKTSRLGMHPEGKPVRNLTAEEVARGIAEDRVLLIDVREPNETAIEGFPGAVLLPLSDFDPARIPDPKGREVVFACRSGRRSVTASQAAQAAGLPYDAHLAGGILAWKAAGHPTES